MKKKLKYSLKNNHIIRFYLRHPTDKYYSGIVLNFTKNIIVFQDETDFELGSVSIMPKSQIKGVRLSKYEKVWHKVLKNSGGLESLCKKPWVVKIDSIKRALELLEKKGIWPAVEVKHSKKDTGLYLGPITKIKKSSFTQNCYDSAGKWDGEYRIKFKDVFCIQVFHQYTKKFNN